MSFPRISVAMAVYNGATFLREQLESFAAQSISPSELVVTDDSSTDDSIEIVEDFAKHSQFPVYIHRNDKTLGYSENFSKAVSLCNGEYIFLSDQDDVWYNSKIEKVASYFDNHPHVMVVMNDADLVDAELRSSGRTQYGNVREAGFPDYYFSTGCCSAHRRSWHQLAVPIPKWVGGHDTWINRLAHESGCAHIISEPLQAFRRHGANASQWELSNPHDAPLLWSNAMLSLRSGAGTNWEYDIRLLREMQERFATVSPGQMPIAAEQADRANRKIRAHYEAIIERTRLCKLPPRHRLGPLLYFWRSGGYSFFRGWKSAAKDLFRPT